jgi:predicted PurR-regulated permease PerM
MSEQPRTWTARPHVRARLQLYILLALATGAAWVIGRLLWPFLPAIGTSVVIASLVWPIQAALARRVRHRNTAALLGTLAVLFLILVPLAALTGALVRVLNDQFGPAAQGASALLGGDGRIADWLAAMGARLGLEPDQLSRAVGDQMQHLTSLLLGRTMAILSGLGGWLLQAGVALFTIFYLLRDGEQLVRAIRWMLPLQQDQTDRLLTLAHEAIRATMLGNVVVAIVQGLIGGLAFWAVGVPAASLWGLIMGVLSLLPVVGPFFVWVPAAVLLIVNGQVGNGFLLAGIGVFIISTIDNVLRSLLISGRAQLHPLAVFFSVLGGILLFGAVGVLLGPVMFVLALTVLEMGRLALLPEASEAPADVGMWLFGMREDADGGRG